MGESRAALRVLGGNLEGRETAWKTGIDGRIILKCVLEE
jgi:hypothetical protein